MKLETGDKVYLCGTISKIVVQDGRTLYYLEQLPDDIPVLRQDIVTWPGDLEKCLGGNIIKEIMKDLKVGQIRREQT